MFIGREKEINQLKLQFSTQKKSAVVVYGKRRIGKSTLIKEASRFFEGIVINHLCVKSSLEGNLSLLYQSVAYSLDLPEMKFSGLSGLFEFLNSQNKKILLVLDEYQYLKESSKETDIDSVIQNIIDTMSDNINLVLCGSYVSIMKELLGESNPLFGRFTQILHIEDFDYYDAAKFYPKLSVREKIRFYSVFGGSPYVLCNINPEISLEQNIVELMINQNSLLRTYIENIMLKEVQKVYDVRILEIIANGKKHYNEIFNLLGMSDSSLLDKQLKNLLSMETIEKVAPINKPSDKKKQVYEIKDNLMRFYFAFIFGHENQILKLGEQSFSCVNIFPKLKNYVSLRFEKIVIQYFMRGSRCGFLLNVLDFGSYWYDDIKNKKNGQFDCVLKENDGYDFYEVKFYEEPMVLSECKEEEKQILSVPNIHCKKIGFVCSAGFDFSCDEYDLVTGEQLYMAENFLQKL